MAGPAILHFVRFEKVYFRAQFDTGEFYAGWFLQKRLVGKSWPPVTHTSSLPDLPLMGWHEEGGEPAAFVHRDRQGDIYSQLWDPSEKRRPQRSGRAYDMPLLESQELMKLGPKELLPVAPWIREGMTAEDWWAALPGGKVRFEYPK